MCIVRLISALVLAASLAVLPVSAAMAMTQAGKAEMSMSACVDHCTCGNSAEAHACLLTCCHLQALTVDGFSVLKAAPADFDAPKAELAIPVSLRPDPPPPRS